MLCSSCGSKGLHIGCGRLEWNVTEWDCEDCSQLARRRESNATQLQTPVVASSSASTPTTSAARRSLAFPPSSSSGVVSNGHVINISPRRNGLARPTGAIKRPHEDDPRTSSSSEESEVDITCISDADSSSAKSLRYDSSGILVKSFRFGARLM